LIERSKPATELAGLHHLTAVTGNAPVNLAFYTQVLGMRQVKQTVNQDDVSAYHLFYGDELGAPGTELTFFDWPGIGPNVPGTGAITETGLRIGGDSLAWWDNHLRAANIDLRPVRRRDGLAGVKRRDYPRLESRHLNRGQNRRSAPTRPRRCKRTQPD